MKSKVIIGALGALGVVVSYAFFIQWMLEHSFSPLAGFEEAMAASVFGAGLHWDLTFSLGILAAMAIADRRLSRRWTAASIAAGCVLGVCAGLALYWVGLPANASEGSDST